MIAGLQKMTLLDYPGKVACTVFLQGCNYACPFCHNSQLLSREGETAMKREDFLAFLKKRQGLLDGVCVSGGEPTLQPDLEDFLRAIKAMGYAVKLDTNGSRPQVLKRLVEEGLVDYVAMDVKNCPRLYGQTVGRENLNLAATEESLKFLLSGKVDYELRTTLVIPFHDAKAVEEMGSWLTSLVPGTKPKRLYLQSFVDRETVAFSGLSAPNTELLQEILRILSSCAEQVSIRNG